MWLYIFTSNKNISIYLDGNWGPWSTYSSCSETCGNGRQTRTRECTNPAPAYGGLDCAAPGQEQQDCKIVECPVGKYVPIQWIFMNGILCFLNIHLIQDKHSNHKYILPFSYVICQN